MAIKAEKIKKMFFIMIVIVTAIAVTNITAFASGDSIQFSVSPNIPDNQVGENFGYFDILVKPGETQELSMSVNNLSDKEMTLEVEAISASTTPSGKINYVTSGIKDETMKHAFSEIASFDYDLVKVPAKDTIDIVAKISVPNEDFKGVVLGGLRAKDITARLENQDNKEKANSEGIKITNEYEYVIGAMLRTNNDTIVPNFELISVQPELVNYKAGISAVFRNSEPIVVKNASYNAQISPKGSDEYTFKVDDVKFDMAPNSVMNYKFMDEAGFGLNPGEYTLTASIDYLGETWDFTSDFVVEGNQAKEINKEAVNQQNENSSGMPTWAVVLIVAVGILVVLLVIIMPTEQPRKFQPSHSFENNFPQKERNQTAVAKSS